MFVPSAIAAALMRGVGIAVPVVHVLWVMAGSDSLPDSVWASRGRAAIVRKVKRVSIVSAGTAMPVFFVVRFIRVVVPP
jgi:hypothetical protein